MPSGNSDQLRADLEALHASLEEGWMCMDETWVGAVRYGMAVSEDDWSHGCLYHQIFKVAVGKPVHVGGPVIDEAESDRMDAMVEALGFDLGDEEIGSGYWTMYDWNDAKGRTWVDVKELVKEAIGRL